MKRLFALLITALVGLIAVPVVAHADDAVTGDVAASSFLSTPVAMGITLGSLLWISIAVAGLAVGAIGLRRTRGALVRADAVAADL